MGDINSNVPLRLRSHYHLQICLKLSPAEQTTPLTIILATNPSFSFSIINNSVSYNHQFYSSQDEHNRPKLFERSCCQLQCSCASLNQPTPRLEIQRQINVKKLGLCLIFYKETADNSLQY